MRLGSSLHSLHVSPLQAYLKLYLVLIPLPEFPMVRPCLDGLSVTTFFLFTLEKSLAEHFTTLIQPGRRSWHVSRV